MASTSDQERLSKLREERVAREKARIDRLRELNLKKYNKTETLQTSKSVSTISLSKPDVKRMSYLPKTINHTNSANRPMTAPTDNLTTKSVTNLKANIAASTSNYKINNTKSEKSNITIRKPEVIPWNWNASKAKFLNKNAESGAKESGSVTKFDRRATMHGNTFKKPVAVVKSLPTGGNASKNAEGDASNANNKAGAVKTYPRLPRKSFIPKFEPPKTSNIRSKPQDLRQSFKPTKVTQSATKLRPSSQPPKETKSATKVNPNRQSVFERLYQPKSVAQKKNVTDSEKIQNDPSFFNKMMRNTGLILNKRHTVFEAKPQKEVPVRRSISAVHFKRMSKSELSNCIHKWSSIGENLDKVHLNNISEDAAVKEDKIVSAVKSERKKVKFQTPIYNFNTPKPEELQSRLQNWLQKRGKSIDSYHHLQCFGIHHLAQSKKEFKPLNLEASKFEEFDDEDKENKPVDSDSDNDSYEDTMNIKVDTNIDSKIKDNNDFPKNQMPETNNHDAANDRWRRASYMSDCVTDLNETHDSTLTIETPHVDELLLGALNDLTELLKEGFDWEQCARWLRAIRERFPSAPQTAAYWECRAALEERRGDLPASVQCWEEAIAKGTERSVVEANLDQLLDKFMQLRISPGSSSSSARHPDSKLVDVKNVFKSTIIRFAVQQAKLRQSQEPKFTVTPVRRSARLSAHWSARRTPLQDCTSVHQAGLLVSQHPLQFVPNDKLCDTP